MGKPTGFLEIGRKKPPRRAPAERVQDFREFEGAFAESELRAQGARCMDCGVPFCHQGCPLGNVIPEWNDHTYRGRTADAVESLYATNNFPDVTGRVCPAPCEEACVLKLAGEPVTIKQIERQIADASVDADGGFAPRPPARATGRRVAVVGSGPAGLACAQQLARAGHAVTVFERDDRAGGMLRYGIPDFKLEKWRIDRRLAQMAAEGVEFRCGVDVGRDVTGTDLRRHFDAVCLAGGARRARELAVPGRELSGVHQAMEYLEQGNRAVAGDRLVAPITAAGKHVVILGGGDTGADCLGTAHRQGARSVTQFELLSRPPDGANPATPWPQWPLVMRTSAAHEEGGARDFGVCTTAFVGDAAGRVRALRAVRVAWVADAATSGRAMQPVADSEFEVQADLVLLALGFTGADASALYEQLGLALGPAGTVPAAGDYATAATGVFACGDMRRGQSLVVWAIREGRDAAAAIDGYLARRG